MIIGNPITLGGGSTKVKKMAIEKLNEGTIVRIKEKGVLTDYYLAQHDYQSDLNGSGRTLFVRRECHSARAWHSSNVNAYATSDIDAWLNGEVKSFFDADVREAMGETVFPYTPGNGNTTVTSLSRSIFLLSLAEFGNTAWSGAKVEGSPLPIADILKAAQLNGVIADKQMRSPYIGNTTQVAYLHSNGNPASSDAMGSRAVLWALTLPAASTVDAEPNLDGSYTLNLSGEDSTQDYFNLTIVGGTEQPTDVADNTIWVNTDVDLGLTYLAPNAPTNPQVGDVWVNTTNKYNSNGANASTNLIRVNDNPYLEINVLNISQWDGSAWVTRENSAIYANGAWTTLALWVWNLGTLNEAVGLRYGYGTSGQVGANLTTIPIDGERLVPSSASGYYGLLIASAEVDFSKYNNYVVEFYSNGANARVTIGAFSTNNPTITQSFTYGALTDASVTTRTKYTLDISSWGFIGYPAIKHRTTSGSYTTYIYQWCLTA